MRAGAAIGCLLVAGCASTVTFDPNAPIVSRVVRGADRASAYRVYAGFLSAHHFEITRQDPARGVIVAWYDVRGASMSCSAAERLKYLVDSPDPRDFGANPSVTVRLLISDTPAGAKASAQAIFPGSLKSTSRWERDLLYSVFPPPRQPRDAPFWNLAETGSYAGELMSQSEPGAVTRRCVTALVHIMPSNKLGGALITAASWTRVGWFYGSVVDDTVPEFSFVLSDACGGELRGRASFDASHKRFTGTVLGRDCAGPLTLSFTLERP